MDCQNNENLLTASSNEKKPQLQNIVSTADLKCKLDLRTIALKARNAEYNPKRFAAVIMRIRQPKTTALIFASGKMVCTGAKSEEESKKAIRAEYEAISNETKIELNNLEDSEEEKPVEDYSYNQMQPSMDMNNAYGNLNYDQEVNMGRGMSA